MKCLFLENEIVVYVSLAYKKRKFLCIKTTIH